MGSALVVGADPKKHIAYEIEASDLRGIIQYRSPLRPILLRDTTYIGRYSDLYWFT